MLSSEQWEVNGEYIHNMGMYGLYQPMQSEQGAGFCLCKRTLGFSNICEQIKGKLMHISRDENAIVWEFDGREATIHMDIYTAGLFYRMGFVEFSHAKRI